MKKQSSIEFLEQRIKEMFLPLSQEETLLKDIQQAKQMHKQEWVEAYISGKRVKNQFFDYTERFKKYAEQCYNDIYG